jgi:hypothetical protein
VRAGKLFLDLTPRGIEHQFNLQLLQLTEGYLCYDTLFLMPQRHAHDNLVQLASAWKADEMKGGLSTLRPSDERQQEAPCRPVPDKDRGVRHLWWD